MRRTVAELALLNLADRAEKGALRPKEANALRAGIGELADKHRNARSTVGGLENRVRELKQKLTAAERDLLLSEPYRVPCTHCGAQPGQRCKAVRGTTPPRTPHVARLDAARRAAR